MLIREILVEDISKETALRNINDILVVRLPELYRRLTDMAQKYVDDHGELDKGFNFIAGGRKAAWNNEVYHRELKPALYSLLKFMPSGVGSNLKSYLSQSVDADKVSLEKLIPELESVAYKLGDKKLLSSVKVAIDTVKQYRHFLDNLSIEADDDEPRRSTKQKEPNSMSQQQSQVEDIINDILNNPAVKKHAGNIRNKIAKSSNKLAALQQELKNLGITL